AVGAAQVGSGADGDRAVRDGRGAAAGSDPAAGGDARRRRSAARPAGRAGGAAVLCATRPSRAADARHLAAGPRGWVPALRRSGCLGSVMLIDSHCQPDFDALAGDLDGVLARAPAAGVDGMVTISTWVDKFAAITAIAEAHETVWCSVGTHPHNADQELHIQTEDLVRLSAHPKCVAIGEAGLDYFYDNAPREAQATGLRRHIAAARITGLPLVIHSRAADDDMAAILEQETAEQGPFPIVLHCFTAGMELAKRGLALGGYVSFSVIITLDRKSTRLNSNHVKRSYAVF